MLNQYAFISKSLPLPTKRISYDYIIRVRRHKIIISFLNLVNVPEDSNYDVIEEDLNSPNALNAEGDQHSVENDQGNVIENPYYGGCDDLNQDTPVINVMENPYYGELDAGEDGVDETRISVIENPYYGEIDDLSIVEEK